MATTLYVPGPAYLYLAPAPASLGGTPTYVFMGQTEGDLQVSEQAAEEDVFVDETGPRVPYDLSFLGKEAFVGGTLAKYNETVWQTLAARVAGGTFGAIAATDIGTLFQAERKYFKLAVACPYATKAAYSGNMPAGYTFQCGVLHASWDVGLSVRHKRQRFAMRFIPEHQADGSHLLFSLGLPGSLPAIS